jgi:hypothetical protein
MYIFRGFIKKTMNLMRYFIFIIENLNVIQVFVIIWSHFIIFDQQAFSRSDL